MEAIPFGLIDIKRHRILTNTLTQYKNHLKDLCEMLMCSDQTGHNEQLNIQHCLLLLLQFTCQRRY